MAGDLVRRRTGDFDEVGEVLTATKLYDGVAMTAVRITFLDSNASIVGHWHNDSLEPLPLHDIVDYLRRLHQR